MNFNCEAVTLIIAFWVAFFVFVNKLKLLKFKFTAHQIGESDWCIPNLNTLNV